MSAATLVAAVLGVLVVFGADLRASSVPAALPLVLGALLLLAGLLNGGAEADPVVDRFEAPDTVCARRRRETALVHSVVVGAVLLAAAAAVVVTVLTDRVG